MYAPAGDMTSFTGTLVGRRWQPGQKYIQLVFKTTEGLKLSLSRNLNMVRTLNVGHTYWVEGPEISLEQKTFIHEPVATLIQPTKSSLFKQYKIFFAIGAVVVFVATMTSVLALTKPASPNNTQAGGQQTAVQKTTSAEKKDVSNAAPTSAEQSQLNAREASNTPAQIKKTTTKTAPAVAATNTTQTASSNPASQTPAQPATNQTPPPEAPAPDSTPPPLPAPSPDPSGDTTP
jgi:hypothetical protein